MGIVFTDVQTAFHDCSFCPVIHSSSSSSRINHVFVITLDLLLFFMFILNLIQKVLSREDETHPCRRYPVFSHALSSPLQLSSIIINSSLCIIYLGLGLWILIDDLRKGNGVTPLQEHQWFVMLLHGFTWMLTSSTLSFPEKVPSKFLRWTWLVAALLLGSLLCALSVVEIFVASSVTMKIVVNVMYLPGVVLLFSCTLKGSEYIPVAKNEGDSLCLPLNGKSNSSSYDDNLNPFTSAGFFSRISFWWLNPLIKRGYEKILDDSDMLVLCETDRSETCCLLFKQELSRQKQNKQIKSQPPSILWTIVCCNWKAIIVSGIFALFKILTLSSGPVLLNAFIKFSEQDGGSIYQGCGLALSFFLLKCFESISQRQWYFRSRAVGVRVRSLLSAEIYQKQLRLSNSAKLTHSSGEIMNYLTVDCYRIGEFPFWFHQTWTTVLQICIALVILYNIIGLAIVSALAVIVLTVICNLPMSKLQHKFQSKLMEAQDVRLKAVSEAIMNMKVLKLYAWEAHFKIVIEGLRKNELKWLSAFQLRKGYNSILFWASPVFISAASFGTCYLIRIQLDASTIFTFVATMRLLQDPIRTITNVVTTVIQAKVSFGRIVKFLDAPELDTKLVRKMYIEVDCPIIIKSANFSWEASPETSSLKNINLEFRHKDKVAICGEVGSGKSTLLAAILGEIPSTQGLIKVCGKIAYVSQTAWIPQGTMQENILFGSSMDERRYHDTLEKCSLVKDLDMLPYGDLTEIGERGVNLSGGQKQRLQLARALYQDADIYLLDDPFSAVDAHTATSLFNDYVVDALSDKTVLLVTHQVDFLPSFNSVLLMSNGEILDAAPYSELIYSSREFRALVNSHKVCVVGSENQDGSNYTRRRRQRTREDPIRENRNIYVEKNQDNVGNQLIKKEEREIGNIGLKPYLQYLNQNRGFVYFGLGMVSHAMFIVLQISQNLWMAVNVDNSQTSQLRLITVYLAIGFSAVIFLFIRSLSVVVLGLQASKSLFAQLLNSIFRAPMTFFDSTPHGRILSRVSFDLSIVDLDLPFTFMFSVAATLNAYSNLGVLAAITWQVLFVSIPMVYLVIHLQKYYFATAKELMRINGTTKSLVANHLSESISGAMTIRAFEQENQFFAKCVDLIDKNASPFLHIYIANEWLILRMESMSAAVLSSMALVMVLLPSGTFSSGFIGMALSYGLSLNISLIFSIQNQCTLANSIISVERLNQYMSITSEAPEVIEANRPTPNWPSVGRVEIQDLKIRYRPDTPIVLHGLSCTFCGGSKIGIVGRTGSGKTTLIGALFRLVEPSGGKILIDGIDITTVGVHDLRSRFAIIPQDPTLFSGTIRYNLDPLGQYTDREICVVLDKCQLRETVLEKKEQGLDCLVVEDGSNWSMGQRQLFCLCRALLRRSRILVLDEATASIDNATDAILQKTIREEFADSTVITVAHRIPTVMDSTMVLAISDGKLVEFDRPEELMQTDGSLFQKLVQEYWSHAMP